MRWPVAIGEVVLVGSGQKTWVIHRIYHSGDELVVDVARARNRAEKLVLVPLPRLKVFLGPSDGWGHPREQHVRRDHVG